MFSVFSHCSTSREEQRRFEKERADEVYCSLKRAKKIAKKRTEEMSQNVEVFITSFKT